MIKSKSVSSKDVAKEAGVSQATVSYVLNNVQGIKIKPETKEAVIAAARKLNYYPNLIARSMRLKKSMSIGIVSDKNVSNFMFMQVLEGIKEALVPKNYSITLCFNKSSEVENAEHIKYFSSNRIDGIIFVYANLNEENIAYLVDKNIPFAIIHNNVSNEMIHVVKNEMLNAVTDAVEHLKSNGHKRIAYFGTSFENTDDRRYNGYRIALERCGLELDPQLLLKIPAAEDEMDEVIEKYFNLTNMIPDAIVCEATNIGFKTLKYAASKGIKVPSELAVIAIGTSKFSPHTYPAMSAIEAPLYDMGFKGVEMLLDILEGTISEDIVVLEWSFVARDSS